MISSPRLPRFRMRGCGSRLKSFLSLPRRDLRLASSAAAPHLIIVLHQLPHKDRTQGTTLHDPRLPRLRVRGCGSHCNVTPQLPIALSHSRPDLPEEMLGRTRLSRLQAREAAGAPNISSNSYRVNHTTHANCLKAYVTTPPHKNDPSPCFRPSTHHPQRPF